MDYSSLATFGTDIKLDEPDNIFTEEFYALINYNLEFDQKILIDLLLNPNLTNANREEIRTLVDEHPSSKREIRSRKAKNDQVMIAAIVAISELPKTVNYNSKFPDDEIYPRSIFKILGRHFSSTTETVKAYYYKHQEDAEKFADLYKSYRENYESQPKELRQSMYHFDRLIFILELISENKAPLEVINSI